jgi:thiopeptide-type bacteriocin biosynthesis protein
MGRAHSPRFFRRTDGALLRAAPQALCDLGWPEVTAETADLTPGWSRWLREVWAQRDVAAAIEVASPVLARRVEDLIAGRPIQARQLRRMVLSMVRYLARMSGRATPFGLFAGVAAIRFGDEATVKWGQRHRVIADVDAGWLTCVITHLESCAQLVRRLSVVANNMCFIRGDRLVLPRQGHAHENGRPVPAEIVIRHTPAVQLVLDTARMPIRCAEVATRLAAAFPGTPEPVVEEMLIRLVGQGVLVSGLRAPGTVPDALEHLLDHLTAVNADEIRQVAPVVHELRDIHDALGEHNRASSPELAASLRRSVSDTMTTLLTTGTGQPLKIDLRLDGEVTVPEAVAQEAELAATALLRLTPYPTGTPAWQDYHDQFVEQFGIGTLVPVTDLVDPGSGLGFPAGYAGSERAERPRIFSARDARLLALAQHATADGHVEIVLDEAEISDLARDAPAALWAPSHTEICVEVHACSPDALTRGDFTLVVTAASRAAGTVTGRFAALLDPAGRDRMAAALGSLPAGDPAASPVQMSFPPLAARSGNVIRGQAFLPEVIALGEHRPDPANVIGLDDLSVGSDGNHLFLASAATRRRVEPTVFHALEFRVNTSPIARFLCEVSRATCAVYGIFDWGAASALPWLPRIRYRRSILSAARWNLPANELPGQGTPWPAWATSLAAWRHRCRVPASVHLWEADRRLELDLDLDAHRAVLRAHLDRKGHAMLTDAPDPKGRGWMDGRASELVVPLVSTVSTAAAGRTSTARTAGVLPLVSRGHGHLPGRPPWLYAKIYAPTRAHNVILRDYVPGLMATWDTPREWWFVRYRDPHGPHLRLRIRVNDEQGYARTAHALGSWVDDLRRYRLAGGLVFDTYYPEIGRYGAGAAITAAEAVFAADSRAVLAQLDLQRTGMVPAQAVIAASLTDTVIAFTGDTTAGLRWLVDRPVERGPVPRDAAAWAFRLAGPDSDRARLSELPGGGAVRDAWQERAHTLTAYRARLAAAADILPDSTLTALLHMHHNRAAGIDAEGERVCRRLARAAVLAWTRQADKAGTR